MGRDDCIRGKGSAYREVFPVRTDGGGGAAFELDEGFGSGDVVDAGLSPSNTTISTSSLSCEQTSMKLKS